ncbi:MAG: dihydroorotase [bacterium]
MIIRNGNLALPGADRPVKADLRIVDGVITAIGRDLGAAAGGAAAAGAAGRPDAAGGRGAAEEVIDAEGLLVLPGGIDPHVHFDEPGYTDREDFYHGSSAAASGGITTVIDMPCTSIPPVTNLANLKEKDGVVGTRAVIDYGFYGGVSGTTFGEEPGYAAAMAELAPEVLGFKCYLNASMESFPRVSHWQLLRVLEAARDVGRPVLLHAEDADFIRHATEAARMAGDSPYHYYLSRPEIAEVLAVRTAVSLAELARARLHIVHVAAGEAARIVGESEYVTGETAPHYLAFDVDDFERIGSAMKVAPSVKTAVTREALRRAIEDGTLSFVASDHAPAPSEQKHTGSVWTDYSGIPGSGTLLPYMFSEGYSKGRISLSRLVEVTSRNAARRYGLDDRKGALAPGQDGDVVLMDPDDTWTVRGADFLSKGKITPFEGMTFQGRVVKTIVRGSVVYDAERGITVKPGYGRRLRAGGT